MKFTFNRKLLLGFTFCALVLFIAGLISLRNSEKLSDTNGWVVHTYEVLATLDQTLIAVVDAETGMRGYVISGNDTFLEPFNRARTSYREHLDQAIALTLDNPARQQDMERLRRLFSEHYAYLEECLALRTRSSQEAIDLIASGKGKKITDEIRAVIANAKSSEIELLTSRREASDRDTSTFKALLAGLLAAIVAGLGATYFIIVTNLRTQKRLEAETTAKNWSLAGSSELTGNLQGNKSAEQLGQIAADHLTTYLGVLAGAVYIAEGRQSLKLVGSHALAYQSQPLVLRFGEGMAGQCAAEKKIILAHDVKPQHFEIGSSFGKLRPSTIICVPLVFEENVVGVVELGALQNFTNVQTEYLQFVSSSIAIALLSAQIRAEAKELLEETQRQAEELESQQLELRQTNDELHAKTEMLERSEATLKTQQAELQNINIELEEKANQLERQKSILETAKDEIEQKSREVEITSKYKSEFLANMSHELRTPLNSILILSQLLTENKSRALTPKDIEHAKNIHSAGSDLLSLINEILDLSKIEAGKMQLEIDSVPVQDMIDHQRSVFSEIANERLIRFRIDCTPAVAAKVILTDRHRVEQILKNLLSNAFKFTGKEGNVTLRVKESAAGEPYAEGGLSFIVSDDGIGIPRDKLEVIFEAFQQVDGSTKRKYGGTGLGLSISRELAHALGGDLQVQSEEEKGSTFILSLPWEYDPSRAVSVSRKIEIRSPIDRKASRPEARHASPAAGEDHIDDRLAITGQDKVVVIIEDEIKFAGVLLDLVRERNYKGIVATQGPEGISFVRHYKPEAIFLDINLPVMDGIEVLKQIKGDPELRHIPVQIISAYDEKKQGLALGAFDFIRKPVTTEVLQKAFEKIESFKSKKLKRLLIVEDNQAQNNAIRELIGNGDVKCYSAYKGLDAYEMLRRDPFDCLIVDLGLPDISGIELLEKIKSDDRLNRIPIIVYTGRDLRRDEIAVLNKLADTVVLKTADSKERLLDETTLFLHRVEAKLPKEKQNMIRKLHRADEVLKNKKILLVDDDIRNIYSLSNVLEDEGVQCITAENGRQAVETLTRDPSIDLVLMDIMMPEMDGYEATAAIRQVEHLKKLPIIALTAKAMKGDKEKCLAAGMSDYISKPVNVGQLLSLLRVWLYK